MVEYSPPPASLDHLNPIQRYMQKGKLDYQDYVYLALLVFAYWNLKPYIIGFFKHKEQREGEQIQKEYMESKSKPKVGANKIRDVKTTTTTGSKADAGTSGAETKPASKLVNRKAKDTIEVAEVPSETAEQLLEWDDITTTGTTEGGKTEITKWLDKWEE